MISKQLCAIGALSALLVAGSAGDAFQSLPLRSTEWKLTHLGGKAVTVADPQTAPSLMLGINPTRFSGSGGCNRIMGTYQLNAASITFGPAAGTRMACASGMDTEAAFVEGLAHVKTWRINGRVLELLNAGSQVVARFEALNQGSEQIVGAPHRFIDKVWKVDSAVAPAPSTSSSRRARSL